VTEEPYALVRARTGLREPWAGNRPGPLGQEDERARLEHASREAAEQARFEKEKKDEEELPARYLSQWPLPDLVPLSFDSGSVEPGPPQIRAKLLVISYGGRPFRPVANRLPQELRAKDVSEVGTIVVVVEREEWERVYSSIGLLSPSSTRELRGVSWRLLFFDREFKALLGIKQFNAPAAPEYYASRSSVDEEKLTPDDDGKVTDYIKSLPRR